MKRLRGGDHIHAAIGQGNAFGAAAQGRQGDVCLHDGAHIVVGLHSIYFADIGGQLPGKDARARAYVRGDIRGGKQPGALQARK